MGSEEYTCFDLEQVVRAIAGIGSTRELSPTVWALDSYYQARQQAESLHQQQALMHRAGMQQGAVPGIGNGFRKCPGMPEPGYRLAGEARQHRAGVR